jgi:hypothetical protein
MYNGALFKWFIPVPGFLRGGDFLAAPRISIGTHGPQLGWPVLP